MACYHPIDAYKNAVGGRLTIGKGGRGDILLRLPCGRCIGCRISRVQDWTTRIMNEAAMHDTSCFITLTYNEENYEPSLNYEHYQKFIRALRKAKGHRIRYFVAGEYGSLNWRPHWHAILFGVNFRDTYQVGKNLVASHEVDELWHRGSHAIGEVNKSTAAYTAAYCVKKITGRKAEEHYTRLDPTTGEVVRLEPEMARMSLKPGLGATWYEKYKKEIHYARDGVVENGGRTKKVPRYYDKILEKKDNKQKTEITNKRIKQAIRRKTDNTKQRLESKEIVAIAKHSQGQRKL